MTNTSTPRERQSVADPHLVEALLDEHAVARFFGVSVATVRRWRWLKIGPVFRKIGSCVRYERAALESYLRSLPTGGGQPEAR